MMTKVVHDTDIGSGLEISGGKLNAAGSMATDAEVAAVITAADALEDAEDSIDLFRSRVQSGLFHDAPWELNGYKIKITATTPSIERLITIAHARSPSTMASGYLTFTFPTAGATIYGLGQPNTVVDSNGFITLPDWGVLWFNLANGLWYVSKYNGTNFDPPESSFIRVLTIHHDQAAGGHMAVLSSGRQIAQGINYPDTGWISLTSYLVAGMSNYGSGFADVRFRRFNNRVYLEGLLNTTSTIGYVGGIANLPSGFRPSKQHVFLAAVHNGVARIDVGSNGLVQIITNSGGQSWVSLDGISFDLA